MAPRARGGLHWVATRLRFDATECGISLVEIAVTVAILGLALTGVVGAMGSTVKMSGVATSNARVESEARRVAEAVRLLPDVPSCRNPSSVAFNKAYYTCVIPQIASLWPWPGDLAVAVTSVECGGFNSADPPQPQYTTTDGCSGSPPDFHRVTIAVTATGGASASVTFVKRQASA